MVSACCAVPAGALEVRNQLSQALQVDLPATIVFDFPTIDALAAHLAGLAGSCPPTAVQQQQQQRRRQYPDQQQSAAPSRMHIQQQIMTALGSIAGHDIDPDEPLAAAGLDSLAAVELRNELCRQALSPTQFHHLSYIS